LPCYESACRVFLVPRLSFSTLFPYTTLFRSVNWSTIDWGLIGQATLDTISMTGWSLLLTIVIGLPMGVYLFLCSEGQLLQNRIRSEEHTSELQSRFDLVCRLLLEKKKRKARR